MYYPTVVLATLISAAFIRTSSAAPVEGGLLKRYAVVPNLIGAPVVIAAGTYPRANKLSDGSILGTFTAFEGGDNIIRAVLSTDNGQSWLFTFQCIPLNPMLTSKRTFQGDVTRGPSKANDIDNAYTLQLPSGRVLCAFRNHSKDPSTGKYTYFRITICYSDDKGKTWSYLSQPASDVGPVNGNWEPFLRSAQDGSLQLYYSRENAFDDQDTLERFSTDGGATWTPAQTISGAGLTSRDGMTGVTTISGSTLLAVFETSMDGTFKIGAITSTDDGKTWGGRKIIYTPVRPNTSSGAPQIINVGGTLVVCFITNEDESLSSPAPEYTGKTAVKLITSGDGGSTWGNKITVGNVQSLWPGMLALDSKTFLTMYDNGGVKAQRIALS